MGVSYDNLKVFEIQHEEEEKEGRKMYRSIFRFAPGPYGIVMTEWFTGQKGADMVIDQLRRLFHPTT